MPLNCRPLVALLLVTTTALGQIRQDAAKAIDAADQIHPLLIAHQEQIAQRYKKDGTKVPQFSKWVTVDSVATQQLFPGLRFASIDWDEAADPGAKDRFVSLAGGLQTTLAVDPKAGSVVAQLAGHGNYEAFGALLIERKVRLREEADAKAIWQAFCDIHHKHWQEYPLKRTNGTEWRLGLSSYDQTIASDGGFKTVVTRTHSMRVVTDAQTHHILAWESVVDTANERRIPSLPE